MHHPYPDNAKIRQQFHLITRMPNLRFGIRELPLEGKPCNARHVCSLTVKLCLPLHYLGAYRIPVPGTDPRPMGNAYPQAFPSRGRCQGAAMTDEVARVCSTDMSLLMPSRAIAQRQCPPHHPDAQSPIRHSGASPRGEALQCPAFRVWHCCFVYAAARNSIPPASALITITAQSLPLEGKGHRAQP